MKKLPMNFKFTMEMEKALMEFTELEIEQIKYALDYLHDADISDFPKEELEALESAMRKLDMDFDSYYTENEYE